MKFATLAALLGCASAINTQNTAEEEYKEGSPISEFAKNAKTGCISKAEWHTMFKKLDTAHTGQLNGTQMFVELNRLAKTQNHVLTGVDWGWIGMITRSIDKVKVGLFSEYETWLFYNAVYEHFGLCHLVRTKKQDLGARITVDGCVSEDLAANIFDEMDGTQKKKDQGNGKITIKVLAAGIEGILQDELHKKFTSNDWAHMIDAAREVGLIKKHGLIHKDESFYQWINLVFENVGLCTAALKHEASNGCLSKWETNAEFTKLDTNHNGSLQIKELQAGLEELAAANGHVLTDDEKHWLETTEVQITGEKNKDKVNKQEFWEFANAVFEHFELCHYEKSDNGAGQKNTGKICYHRKDAEVAFKYLDTNGTGQLGFGQVSGYLMGQAEKRSGGKTDPKTIEHQQKWLLDAKQNIQGTSISGDGFWAIGNGFYQANGWCKK